MTARLALVFILLVSCRAAGAETVVTARLKSEFKETYAYTPPAAVEVAPDLKGEPVLVLEPMIITRAGEEDILAEARRANEARKAREFSLLRGGTLLSFRRGEIGFWPMLVPVDATPVKKGTVVLAIDLLRIKW